jgi:hypothetical protein
MVARQGVERVAFLGLLSWALPESGALFSAELIGSMNRLLFGQRNRIARANA